MGAVAAEFGISPHDAHLELGGRPLKPRERRRMTFHVLEATRAMRLHADFMGTEGDEAKSEALMKRWTADDHTFYKALRQHGDGG